MTRLLLNVNIKNVDIPMRTNCAPLLADLLLHAYEADVLQGLLKNKDRKIIPDR